MVASRGVQDSVLGIVFRTASENPSWQTVRMSQSCDSCDNLILVRLCKSCAALRKKDWMSTRSLAEGGFSESTPCSGHKLLYHAAGLAAWGAPVKLLNQACPCMRVLQSPRLAFLASRMH